MSKQLKEHNIEVLMVYINEAHSERWPIGRESHPTVHQSFEDRVQRAQQFHAKESIPYPTFVDNWSNVFSDTFHSWPDRYVLSDVNKIIVRTAEYG
jgi:hypothetical protein